MPSLITSSTAAGERTLGLSTSDPGGQRLAIDINGVTYYVRGGTANNNYKGALCWTKDGVTYSACGGCAWVICSSSGCRGNCYTGCAEDCSGCSGCSNATNWCSGCSSSCDGCDGDCSRTCNDQCKGDCRYDCYGNNCSYTAHN